jgi:phosphohistidine phosphatase
VHEPTPPSPRLLVTMRHARAQQVGRTDFDRELTDGGIADAREAGSWLRSRRLVPDAAMVSAAARAVGTWEALAAGAGWELDPVLDRALYPAGADTALDLVRETPPAVRTLVVVGHNPTIATMAQLLDDGDGDEAAATQMLLDFPAGALAVFEYDGDWADLDWASARVVGFHIGAG